MGQTIGKELKSADTQSLSIKIDYLCIEYEEIKLTLKDHHVTNYKKRHKFYKDLQKKLNRCNISLVPVSNDISDNDQRKRSCNYTRVELKANLQKSDALSLSSLFSVNENTDKENTVRKTVKSAAKNRSHTSLCESIDGTQGFQNIHAPSRHCISDSLNRSKDSMRPFVDIQKDKSKARLISDETNLAINLTTELSTPSNSESFLSNPYSKCSCKEIFSHLGRTDRRQHYDSGFIDGSCDHPCSFQVKCLSGTVPFLDNYKKRETGHLSATVKPPPIAETSKQSCMKYAMINKPALKDKQELQIDSRESDVHLGRKKKDDFQLNSKRGKEFKRKLKNDFHNFERVLREFLGKQKLRNFDKKCSPNKCIEIFDQLLLNDPSLSKYSDDKKTISKLLILGVDLTRHEVIQVYPIHGLQDYFKLMSVPVSERPPHGETMRFEWVRVRSFWSFPSNIRVSPVGLSRVGFYYTGKVSECRCFCCGAVYKDWKDGDDPYTIHREISPTCPYLNGNESGNVPVHEEDRFSPRPEVAQTLLASGLSEPREAAALAGNEAFSGIRSSESLQIPGSSQIGDFTFRLPAIQQTATVQPSLPQPGAGFFSRPPQPNLNTVTPLTSSGGQQPTGENVPARSHSDQFSFGVPPRTQAPATTQPTLVLRQPGQQSAEAGQPSFAPQSSQPSLQFNQESNASRPTSAQSTSGQSQPTTSARSNQTPLTTTAATNLTTTSNVNRSTSTAQSASSTSTHAGPSTEPTTSQAGAISESSRSRFDPLGINFEKPKYPAYAVLTVRINTYNGWPDYLDQSPRDMALAGFFYAGYGDYTRCFFCGGGLRNWEAGDDPWVEHARWFPKCAFLRQNQGEKFVNIVQQKHQEAEAANRPLVLPRQLSVLDRGAGSSDIMSSVCVQTLREMGKDDNVIREAIEKWQNRRRPGIPVNSAELQATEIYEIILQIEEERDTRNRPSLQASRPTSSTSPNNQLVPQSSSMVASGEQGEGATAASDPSEKFEGLDEVFDEWLINKMKLTCKICQDNPVAIAFLPCGHLVCCLDCAPAMRKCPSCHHVVKGTIKTFFP